MITLNWFVNYPKKVFLIIILSIHITGVHTISFEKLSSTKTETDSRRNN